MLLVSEDLLTWPTTILIRNPLQGKQAGRATACSHEGDFSVVLGKELFFFPFFFIIRNRLGSLSLMPLPFP